MNICNKLLTFNITLGRFNIKLGSLKDALTMLGTCQKHLSNFGTKQETTVN